MQNRKVVPTSDSTPLPLIVAGKWNFKLKFHLVEGEHFYAIEDWITGITSASARKSQKMWANLKNKMMFIDVQKFPHIGPDDKVYQKNHTDEDGLKLIAQSLRVTRTRMELADIQTYLVNPSVFKKRQNRIRMKKPLRSEKSIRNALIKRLQKIYGDNVETEVHTPVGNADIVTPDEIIEVKEAKCWKHALGQAMAYGIHLPDKKKRIHLFRGNNRENRKVIEETCKAVGVAVSWEEQAKNLSDV